MKIKRPFVCSIFISLVSFTLVAQPTNWEWKYLRKLEQNRTTAGIHFNQFISDASDPLALAIPAAFFIKGVIAKDQKDKRRGIYLAESFAANVAFTYLFKKTINRKRPGETDPTFSVLTPASSRSFPSGHTSEAFSLATSLTIALPKWYIIAPAYTFAGLVGYSRMYLGAHYPSDVIAGALVGSGTAWLSYQLNKKIVQRKKSAPR
jgi:membrane-associated phospholipid phosphatase